MNFGKTPPASLNTRRTPGRTYSDSDRRPHAIAETKQLTDKPLAEGEGAESC
jgi:hypothetical protein